MPKVANSLGMSTVAHDEVSRVGFQNSESGLGVNFQVPARLWIGDWTPVVAEGRGMSFEAVPLLRGEGVGVTWPKALFLTRRPAFAAKNNTLSASTKVRRFIVHSDQCKLPAKAAVLQRFAGEDGWAQGASVNEMLQGQFQDGTDRLRYSTRTVAAFQTESAAPGSSWWH